MLGTIAKIILGIAARLPGEARAQTLYDSDKYGYISPSDGRIAGDEEMKFIREYNERVARDISVKDKAMDDFIKEVSPIHSSLGGAWRDGNESMNLSRRMNAQSLVAQEVHSSKTSQMLQTADHTPDFQGMENKIAGAGAATLSDNADMPDSVSYVAFLEPNAVLAQAQALIQAMAAFSPATAGQILLSMQEPTRLDAVLVADGR
jgi:hypothetical protein